MGERRGRGSARERGDRRGLERNGTELERRRHLLVDNDSRFFRRAVAQIVQLSPLLPLQRFLLPAFISTRARACTHVCWRGCARARAELVP
jgi:hypothetical protein